MASTPTDVAATLLQRVDAADSVGRISAQAHARNVLFEVNEQPENFPRFDTDLDERTSMLAYSLLHVGCSFVETGDRQAGSETLTRAATLLQYCYAGRASVDQDFVFQVLVAALAYYVAGQYSRAFVLVRAIDPTAAAAKVVAAFLRKQLQPLIGEINGVLLNPEFGDDAIAAVLAGDDLPVVAIDRVLTSFTAKALAFCAEFVFSGRTELLVEAREWLNDGAEVARNSDHAPWWWIFRLMTLLIDDLGSASPWSILPKLCPGSPDKLANYLQLLPFLKPCISELWTSQRDALPIALDAATKGAAISLRTSAGKTRVAEIAAIAEFASDPSAKVLYIAPFRSLAVEIERVFRKTFEPLGLNVSHLYGGSRSGAIDTELLDDAHVIIATPEKLRSLIRCSRECVLRVKLVIVDEGHLIGLEERFVRNELFLDHLRAMCRRTNARILLLSAVLPNVDEIAQWISGSPKNVGKSDWKPAGERYGRLLWNGNRVKLEWRGSYESYNPFFVSTEKPRAPRRKVFPASKQEAVASTAVRLSSIGPVLIFAGLAVSVKKYAAAVIYALGKDPAQFAWPSHEWNVFKTICEEYYDDDAIEVKAAKFGIICHHARLPNEVRLALERLMAAKPPKVVIATSTLAQGVNFGFTSVIMANIWVSKRPIPVRDFWNIAGRAGRAFVDTEGKILFAIDETEKPWQVSRNIQLADTYFNSANLENVDSGLLKLLQLVKHIADSAGVSFDTLVQMSSENVFSGKEQLSDLELLFDLIDDEILALYEELSEENQGRQVTAIEDLLRSSLAAIQAQRPNAVLNPDQVIQLLKARLAAALKQFPTADDIRTVVCSGFPLRASTILKNNIHAIAELVQQYIAGGRSHDSLLETVRFFETLSASLPNICREIPSEAERDLVRDGWLRGVPLKALVTKTDNALKITADYYGYGIPWIIHASAQQLRSSENSEVADELDKIGLLVELGIPSASAAKIYLCGVRSRFSAVEIASRIRNVEKSSLRQLRLFLTTEEARERLKPTVDEVTQHWLDILDAEERSTRQSAHTIQDFQLVVPDAVTILHVRQFGESYYLCATDYSFIQPVQSNATLPFRLIANDPRYIFNRMEASSNVWRLKVRDPQLAARPAVTEVDFF